MKPLAFRWRIALGSACVTALALAMFSAIVAYALYRQDIRSEEHTSELQSH